MSTVVAFALVRCSVRLSWKLEGIEATLPTLQLRAATLPGIRAQVSWFPTQPSLWTLAHPFALGISQQLPAGHITWHVDHVHQAFIADENLCVKVLCWINSVSAWERGTEAWVYSSGIWWWWLAEKRQCLCGLLATRVLILGSFLMILGCFLRAERFLEPSFINIASILVEQREQRGITEKSPDMNPECQVCQFAVTPAFQVKRNIPGVYASFCQ